MRAKSTVKKQAKYHRSEKWPREYAHDIIMMQTKEQRKAAFDAVPDKFKAMVRDHINTFRAKTGR